MENKLKHLEFIQMNINRMSKNSFLLKGWSLTLIVALFAVTDNNISDKYVLIAFYLITVFWFLDSYYLCEERKFRILFDQVRALNKNEIDFSMKANDCDDLKYIWGKSFFSKT